jgi:hypothetical protein
VKRILLAGSLFALISTTCGAGEIYDLYVQSHSGTYPISSKSRSGADIDRMDSDITEVGIERYGGCLGSCPIYTLVVKSDGSFRYQGQANVDRKGQFTGKIRLWRWTRVVQYIRDMDYFALDERYQASATDQDDVLTTVAKGSRRKTISNYGSAGPIRLWALQVLIDSLLTDAEWDSPH